VIQALELPTNKWERDPSLSMYIPAHPGNWSYLIDFLPYDISTKNVTLAERDWWRC